MAYQRGSPIKGLDLKEGQGQAYFSFSDLRTCRRNAKPALDYTLVRTKVPNNILNGIPPTFVDGGIPAWVIHDQNLEG